VEDPAETLDYGYQKQVELLQNVKKGIADVVTSKKRLQLQEGNFQQQASKLDGQARQALAAGNEELARTALERKNVAQTELQSLDGQVTELEAQQQKLIDSEQKLRAKIEKRENKLVIKEIPFSTTTESIITSIEEAARKKKIKIRSIADFTAAQVERGVAHRWADILMQDGGDQP